MGRPAISRPLHGRRSATVPLLVGLIAAIDRSMLPIGSVRGPAAVGGTQSPVLPVESMGRVTVGPCVNGSAGEVYELIEQLQSALFGGVYRVGCLC